MTAGQNIVQLLRKVDPDSLWGFAIQKVVHEEETPKVMDLIIDLRSQARDSSEVMRSILGDECYEAIMSI